MGNSKRTPATPKEMALPTGTFEVFEVYQQDRANVYRLHGFFKGIRDDITAYVDQLRMPDVRFRRRAAIELEGKLHIVNIVPFNLKDLPVKHVSQMALDMEAGQQP